MMAAPRLELHVHDSLPEEALREVDLEKLIQGASAALPACLDAALEGDEVPLKGLKEIEVTLVSDEVIRRVHDEFMGDPSATDVITFDHGEIVVSVDTAGRQALEQGTSVQHELLLYLIHGCLHLGGWDDHEVEEAQAMARLQDRILKDAVGAAGSGP